MRFALLTLSLGAVSMVACGDTEEETDVVDTDVDTDTEADETARVRLTHLGVFPAEPSAVDIFVNGEKSDITFSFLDATDYVEFPVGTYDFAVVPAGGTIDDAAVVVEDFALAADESWSIVAQGYVAPADDQPALAAGAFKEDYADITAGNTRLNVFHSAALPAFDPVDVWVVDTECKPVGDAPLVPGFKFADVAGGVDIAVGAIGIGLDVGADATVDACFQVPALGDGDVVNVYAGNDVSGTPFLLAQLPGGDTAKLDPVTP